MAGGLPGTGKSTLADAVAGRLGFTVLNSDRIRKELAGVPAETRVHVPYESGIYSSEWTERVYAELLARAAALLEHGQSVIADASFISARQRAAAEATADAASADLVQLRCTASRELATERMAARAGAVSDARPAITQQMENAAEPWPDATEIDSGSVGSGEMPSSPLQQALNAVRPHGPEHVWRPAHPYMLPG